MNIKFTEEQRYYQAQKRITAIKGFYAHLLVYCIVISGIISINLLFSPNFHWFWFSTLGWGMGLFLHWVCVFGFKLMGFGQAWENRKIKKYMQQFKNQQYGR